MSAPALLAAVAALTGAALIGPGTAAMSGPAAPGPVPFGTEAAEPDPPRGPLDPVRRASAVPAPEITWRPESPRQGRLFALRIAPEPGREITGVEGRASGETLHFQPLAGGAWESLVPVAVSAGDEVTADLTVRYASGPAVETRARIPVLPGDFRHERLTVAPRFGRPPTDEERARRARDAGRARAVSAAAHRTPRLWTHRMVIPRDDRITSPFGNGREFNGQISSRHMGLDLDGETGDTIYAVTRGVVELVDEFLLAGNIVYLNHGAGLVTGYFHLSEQLVAQGDTVEAGTPIGRVGATGRVTGPHLHWVVRYGSVSVDPLSLLEVVSGG